MQTKLFGVLAVLAAAGAASADGATSPPAPPVPAATGEATTTTAGATTAGAATQPASDKILLRLRVQAGESYELLTTTDTKMTQIMPQTIAGRSTSVPGAPGGKIDIATGTAMAMRYDVLDVDAQGIATIKLTYNAIRNTMQMPTGEVVYDSTQPQPATGGTPLSQVYGSLIGQSITMKMASDGQVSEVQGMEELTARLMNGLKQSGMPPQVMASMQKTMQESFGDQFLKSVMQQATVLYPDKPVGIGDSWPYQITVAKGFPLAIKGTRTLIARKDGVAMIEEKSDISMDNSTAPGGAPFQVGPIKMSLNISGTQTGTSELDEETGLTRNSQVVQQFSGTIQVQSIAQPPRGGTPQGAAPQSMTMRIYSKTDVTVSMTPVEK